jgi:hypothetical protein
MPTSADIKSDKIAGILDDLEISLDEAERSRQMLIDIFAKRIDRVMIKGVPYLSQLDRPDADFAPGDCGPACVAMVIRHQTDAEVTVDHVSEATGNPEGFRFTNNMTLIRTARKWDVSMYWARHLTIERLFDELDAGRPVIALVHYPSLSMRYDSKYPFSHFIVLVGYDDKHLYYHDPYWPENYRSGDDWYKIQISHSQFNIAWSNVTENGNSARQCLRLRIRA